MLSPIGSFHSISIIAVVVIGLIGLRGLRSRLGSTISQHLIHGARLQATLVEDSIPKTSSLEHLNRTITQQSFQQGTVFEAIDLVEVHGVYRC